MANTAKIPVVLKIAQIYQDTFAGVPASTVVETYDNPGHPLDGFPYVWDVLVEVTPTSHSDSSTQTPNFYNALDIAPGMWLADNSHRSYKIIELIDSAADGAANYKRIRIKDVGMYTALSEPTPGNGANDNTPVYEGGNFAYIFTLSEDGLPNFGIKWLGPPEDISFINNITSRFQYRNLLTANYNNSDSPNPTYSTYQVGQMVYLDSNGVFQVLDASDAAQVKKRFGVITSVNVPEDGDLGVRPWGKVVGDLDLSAFNVGDALYYDDTVGAPYLTATEPASSAIPMYIKISDTTGMYITDMVGGGGDGVTSSGVGAGCFSWSFDSTATTAAGLEIGKFRTNVPADISGQQFNINDAQELYFHKGDSSQNDWEHYFQKMLTMCSTLTVYEPGVGGTTVGKYVIFDFDPNASSYDAVNGILTFVVSNAVSGVVGDQLVDRPSSFQLVETGDNIPMCFVFDLFRCTSIADPGDGVDTTCLDVYEYVELTSSSQLSGLIPDASQLITSEGQFTFAGFNGTLNSTVTNAINVEDNLFLSLTESEYNGGTGITQTQIGEGYSITFTEILPNGQINNSNYFTGTVVGVNDSYTGDPYLVSLTITASTFASGIPNGTLFCVEANIVVPPTNTSDACRGDILPYGIFVNPNDIGNSNIGGVMQAFECPNPIGINLSENFVPTVVPASALEVMSFTFYDTQYQSLQTQIAQSIAASALTAEYFTITAQEPGNSNDSVLGDFIKFQIHSGSTQLNVSSANCANINRYLLQISIVDYTSEQSALDIIRSGSDCCIEFDSVGNPPSSQCQLYQYAEVKTPPASTNPSDSLSSVLSVNITGDVDNNGEGQFTFLTVQPASTGSSIIGNDYLNVGDGISIKIAWENYAGVLWNGIGPISPQPGTLLTFSEFSQSQNTYTGSYFTIQIIGTSQSQTSTETNFYIFNAQVYDVQIDQNGSADWSDVNESGVIDNTFFCLSVGQYVPSDPYACDTLLNQQYASANDVANQPGTLYTSECPPPVVWTADPFEILANSPFSLGISYIPTQFVALSDLLSNIPNGASNYIKFTSQSGSSNGQHVVFKLLDTGSTVNNLTNTDCSGITKTSFSAILYEDTISPGPDTLNNAMKTEQWCIDFESYPLSNPDVFPAYYGEVESVSGGTPSSGNGNATILDASGTRGSGAFDIQLINLDLTSFDYGLVFLELQEFSEIIIKNSRSSEYAIYKINSISVTQTSTSMELNPPYYQSSGFNALVLNDKFGLEFLSTVTKGPQGDTGDQGPVGLTGAQGDQGVQGAQGETGDRGLSGAVDNLFYQEGDFLSSGELSNVSNANFEGYTNWQTSTTGLTSTTASSNVNMIFIDDSANMTNSSGGFTLIDVSSTWDALNGSEPHILSITGEETTIKYVVTEITAANDQFGNGYYKLHTHFLSGKTTIPEDVDLSFSLVPARVDKTIEHDYDFDGNDSSVRQDGATNILSATAPTVSVQGINMPELVRGYMISYNLGWRPWDTPDNHYIDMDIWMSKDGTNGYIQSSWHVISQYRQHEFENQMQSISKTFMVIDIGIVPGDTLQLNVAAALKDASGTTATPADTNLGAMYYSTLTMTPILTNEVSGSSDISGFNITTSNNPTAPSGVTRTFI